MKWILEASHAHVHKHQLGHRLLRGAQDDLQLVPEIVVGIEGITARGYQREYNLYFIIMVKENKSFV